MDNVKWEEPSRGVWFERLEPLKAKPGEWAVVHETPTGETAHKYAWRLKAQREQYKLPDGEWEFKGAKVEDHGVVYARYLGEA